MKYIVNECFSFVFRRYKNNFFPAILSDLYWLTWCANVANLIVYERRWSPEINFTMKLIYTEYFLNKTV